jgi:hypothetical protein
MSDFPARVHGGNTAGQIAIANALEASVADHVRERLLLGEFADALDEVLIRLRRACRQFTKTGNDFKRVEVIEPVEDRHLDLGELKTEKAAARFQHAKRFAQRRINVGDVADAEGNRVGVER